MEKKSKQCIGKCPKCGAAENRIDWDNFSSDNRYPTQEAICTVCGCRFKEIYNYIRTEWLE